MPTLDTLFSHLSLLCEHEFEIIYYHPYSSCKITGTNGMSVPLGAYLQVWKDVPVNLAGKKLITSDLLGADLFSPTENAQLEKESGFDCKYPVPGISRSTLKDILSKHFQHNGVSELPLQVTLEQVIQELQEQLPLQERISYSYQHLQQRMNKAVASLSGTDAFSSKHIPAFTDEADFPYNRRHIHSPLFFRVEQDERMDLLLRIEMRVPVRHPYGRGLGGLTSGREGKAAENLQNSYTEMEVILIDAGFAKHNAEIDAVSIGITALFEKKLKNPLPGEQDVQELATVLAALKQVLEKYKLWNERGSYLKLD